MRCGLLLSLIWLLVAVPAKAADRSSGETVTIGGLKVVVWS